MNKSTRDASGASRWRTRLPKILGLLLVLLYLPYCTAESLNLPDAPSPTGASAVVIQHANASQQQTQTDSTPSQAQTTSTPPSQLPSAQQQQTTTTPALSQTSGVAAAPYINPEGISGSQPAGAAIAPAKQRRRRLFAVRIGLLVGAAIAIGTVVALSESSPSRAN